VARFVLIHGGWHGAWCWDRVVPLLEAEGHDVLAPDLTGQGARADEVTPSVDLSAHAREIAELLESRDVRDAVLVGHSLGGAAITCAAELVEDRIAQLVYLDAFVPVAGRTVFDLLPDFRVAYFEQQAREHGDGWLVPLPWESALAAWGVTAEADLRWMVPLMRPQPLAPFHEDVRSTAAADRLPRAFVSCTDKPGGDPFEAFAEAARAEGSGWSFRAIDAGHDAMITVPAEVASTLMFLVRRAFD
jgi:pimeloyl-ACP methyl ester carboxylesterase